MGYNSHLETNSKLFQEMDKEENIGIKNTSIVTDISQCPSFVKWLGFLIPYLLINTLFNLIIDPLGTLFGLIYLIIVACLSISNRNFKNLSIAYLILFGVILIVMIAIGLILLFLGLLL